MSSSITVDPINNFETNARRSREVAETRTSRGSEPVKRRVMDIEDAIRWAVCDELPKRRAEGDGEVRMVSPMFRLCAFGMPVDNWSREPGFPVAVGTEPHPDAVKIAAAIAALSRFYTEPVDEQELDLGSDFLADPQDERDAMRKAFRSIDALVVRAARLRHRPFWRSRPTISRVNQPNGRPLVLRWEDQIRQLYNGDVTIEALEQVLVPVAPTRKDHYPDGSYCPLRFEQNTRTILEERAEYLAWWVALNAMAEDLFGELETIAVLPPSAAQKPWLGETDLGKPPRIFADLTARVYHGDRATAAAHRALGQRRVTPARRGIPATPIARRPAQVLALQMIRGKRN